MHSYINPVTYISDSIKERKILKLILGRSVIVSLAYDSVADPFLKPHARLAGEMNIPHKDPFDRLLIAQAQAEDAMLVSKEAQFDGFAVKRFW